MRTLLRTVVVLPALALCLFGCDGEEPAPAAQADLERVEQEESTASSATARDAPEQSASEMEQSEAVDEPQPLGQQGASQETAQETPEEGQPEPSGDFSAAVAKAPECVAHPLAEEAARLAELGAPSPDEHQEEPADEEIGSAVDRESRVELLAAARESMAGWYSRLETLTLEASLIADWEWRCINLAVSSTIRLDPLAALSVGDYGGWFELRTGLPLAESDQAALMQDYLYEGRVYSTVTGAGGWGGSRWHYPLDYDDGAIHQWLAVEPSELASYGRGGDELDCVLAEGGRIAEDRYEGEAVWVVTCPSAIGSLMPFEGYPPDSDDGVLSQVVRITISKDSGAPLVSEFQAVARERDGRYGWVSRRVALTGWNKAVELPRPEPLLEGGEVEELFQQFRARAAAPERLLILAQRWKAEQEDIPWTLQIHLETEATADKHRTRLSDVRSADTLERTFFSWEPRGDRVFSIRPGSRLRWNREGFQASDADVDGEPAWRPSTPYEHGFGDTTLETLLAERDWVDLGLFSDLLELGESDVTPPDDGRTNYVLWAMSGVMEPGDPRFERFASLIERGFSELRIGDVEVDRIDFFSMAIRLDAGRRQVTSHGVYSEVVTDFGAFSLRFLVVLDSHLDIYGLLP